MPERYFLETLGCPKNQVDSDKLEGTLIAAGMVRTGEASLADLVVVNTCAFIEAARQESIDTILTLAEQRRDGAKLVVTGCMAERYGDELAEALPEVDQIAGFGVALAPMAPSASSATIPVRIGVKPAPVLPTLDLLNMPRPRSNSPWAYVKIAEGCDRSCGFCAIPSFRGPQRSRSVASILDEIDALRVSEVVLIAQDLASYGKDDPTLGAGSIVDLVAEASRRVERVRLLYLYPSDLDDALVDAICDTGLPYFDLSLQHVSKPLLRRMRRWGDGQRFLDRITSIRSREPQAAFRSNFIVGYPGETESDHDALLRFVDEAQLDWCGFFAYCREEGTHAADLDGQVDPSLVSERLGELTERQDRITAARRDALIGTSTTVLIDSVGVARSHREAPEIDGIIEVPETLPPGAFVDVEIVSALGPDLTALPIGEPRATRIDAIVAGANAELLR
ncbi:MAG: 30S ribosomal protein S12 methylthiotransferase RimO [Acidimicrobiia bacterium]